MPPVIRPLALPRDLRFEAVAVLVGALLVVAGIVWFAGDASPLTFEQRQLNLLVLKELHPGLFERDGVLGGDPGRLYIPGFLKAQATLSRWNDGDPRTALEILLWPVGVLFLVGHYVLFRAVTSSPVAAALAAVSALTVRASLGGDFWGFDGLRSVLSRSIAAGTIPVLMLAFLRWRTRRWMPVSFVLPGALANLHPVSGLHLAEATALAHLWLSGLRWRTWLQLGAGALWWTVGASPFLLSYLPTRDHLHDPTLLSAVRAGIHYRFQYLLFPFPLDGVFLEILFHVAFLSLVLVWLGRQTGLTGDLRGLLAIGVAGVLVTLVGTVLVQLHGILMDRPYVDIQQVRAMKLVYPALLAGLALAYRRLLVAKTSLAAAGLAALFLISLIQPARLIQNFSPAQRHTVKVFLGLSPPEPAALPGRRVEDPEVMSALFAWIKRHTPPQARFLTDTFEFREATLRSATGTSKDGGVAWVAGTRPFYEWYRYMQAVDRCRDRGGEGCWFALARDYDADFVVVDPALPRAGAPTDFERIWERSGWSLWRRRGERVEDPVTLGHGA